MLRHREKHILIRPFWKSKMAAIYTSGCLHYTVSKNAKEFIPANIRSWPDSMPANTRRWPNAGFMLGQRMRHQPKRKTALGHVSCLPGCQCWSHIEDSGPVLKYSLKYSFGPHYEACDWRSTGAMLRGVHWAGMHNGFGTKYYFMFRPQKPLDVHYCAIVISPLSSVRWGQRRYRRFF